MHSIWETHKMEEEWESFSLMPAMPSLRLIARVIRHVWPSGSQLLPTSCTLDQSWSNGKYIQNFKQRRSGIGILHVQEWIPVAKQQWYADYGSTAGYLADIRAQFERLQQLGPNHGYFPEHPRILSHPTMSKKVRLSLEIGSRHLGSFMGAQHWKACRCCTCLPTEYIFCAPALSTTRMTVSTPHNTQHWTKLWSTRESNTVRASPGTFGRSNRRRRFSARACTPSSELFWTGSTKHSRNSKSRSKNRCLQPAHQGTAKWDNLWDSKHTQTIAAAKAAIQTSKDNLHEQVLKCITDPKLAATKFTILRCQEIGKCLQTPPSHGNGTCLFDIEFRDALHLRYCRTSPNLPSHCDGCEAKFSKSSFSFKTLSPEL